MDESEIRAKIDRAVADQKITPEQKEELVKMFKRMGMDVPDHITVENKERADVQGQSVDEALQKLRHQLDGKPALQAKLDRAIEASKPMIEALEGNQTAPPSPTPASTFDISGSQAPQMEGLSVGKLMAIGLLLIIVAGAVWFLMAGKH